MRYLLGVLLGVTMAAGPVWAEHACKGGQCPMMQSGCCRDGHDQADLSECPITNKVIEKAKFFLENAEAIGLDEAQVKTIKGIKMEAKKAKINQKAQMEVFHMDITAKMSESPLDVEGLNTMMDEAAAGMTAGGKGMIATYAKLKAVLTENQMTKAKELWKKSQH